MRHLVVKSVVCLGLLLLSGTALRAERLEATNSTFAYVDGVSRFQAPFVPVTRTVTFTGVESAFGSGTVLDVDITIDFSKLSDPLEFDTPPWYNEIGFALVSPSGTTVELIPFDTFLTYPNFNNTPGFSGVITLDDAAADLVNNGPIPGRPNAGTFRPMNPLSAFNGEDAQGVWTLIIEDSIGANPLLFNAFTLSVQTAPAVVPEPGSVVLGGMSLLALGAVVWRKRRRQA